MTDTAEQEEKLIEPAPLPWGHRLREARQAEGIALRDVAAELHLDLALLEALENEELDKLPSPSFVKGYIRSYARLLDMPADDLVKAFDCVHGEGGPCLKRIGKIDRQPTSRDKGPRYATWAVITIIVVSVLAWWSSRILSNGVASHEREEAGVAIPMEEGSDIATLQPDIEVEGESVSVAPLMGPDAQAKESSAVPAPEAEPSQTRAVTEKSERVTKEDEPAPAPVADLTHLKLTFKEDSWVELTDAQGKRLFYDLGRKGQTKELAGVAPFRVLLGNAAGVELNVDGKVYDHSRYWRRNGAAKFSLAN